MKPNADDLIKKRDVYRLRITPIVNRLMKEREVYREEFDTTEIAEFLITEMEYIPLEKFMAIPDEDLTKRLSGLMTLELISGMLADLSPEQMKIFDEAIARR